MQRPWRSLGLFPVRKGVRRWEGRFSLGRPRGRGPVAAFSAGPGRTSSRNGSNERSSPVSAGSECSASSPNRASLSRKVILFQWPEARVWRLAEEREWQERHPRLGHRDGPGGCSKLASLFLLLAEVSGAVVPTLAPRAEVNGKSTARQPSLWSRRVRPVFDWPISRCAGSLCSHT